jgi:hypothetical protein
MPSTISSWELLFFVCLFVFVWTTAGSENHWFHFVEVANLTIPLIMYLFALLLRQPARHRPQGQRLSYSMVQLTNSRVLWLHAVSYKNCQNSWTYTLIKLEAAYPPPHTHTRTHAHAHIYIHTRTLTQMYIYTHTHTHTHTHPYHLCKFEISNH